MSKNVSLILYSNFVTDQVENVRLTLCKVLKTIYEQCPKEKDMIKKTLRTLSDDKDRDVKELAGKVLKQIS